MTAISLPFYRSQKAKARLLKKGRVGSSEIYYEVHGHPEGIPVFLGFPIMASHGEIFGDESESVKSAYLDKLIDRYRVLLVDYPSIGKSGTTPASALTADRVCRDLLSVADAAGFDRFAYCGFLWGAINGLLLASRADRVSALICGTWPPLDAPYANMLRGTLVNVESPPPHTMVILRDKNQYSQWVTFYESMQEWPEAAAVAAINCPRLVLYGAKAESAVAGIRLPFAEIIRARREDLEEKA